MVNKSFLVVLMALMMSVAGNAYENKIRLSAGFPRVNSFEYQRALNNVFPNLSAYINHGSGNYELESINTKVEGISLGARFKIPFLGSLGLGYAVYDVNYQYNQSESLNGIEVGSTVNVRGTFSGPLLDYLYEFGLGPFVIGFSSGMLIAEPTITATVGGTKIDSDDVTQGATKIKALPQLSFHVGYAF